MQVVVGRIGRPHGIKGEVTVEVRTDEPERRLGVGMTVATDPVPGGPLSITTSRTHNGRLLLGFAGVGTRSQAEALRGLLLVADVDPGERPEDPDEFYDHQLVGLAVFTVGGKPVGAVTETLHLPGQDVLAVRRPDGREVLVPFVAQMVPTVDVAAGRIVIDPPPGLLDDVLGDPPPPPPPPRQRPDKRSP